MHNHGSSQALASEHGQVGDFSCDTDHPQKKRLTCMSVPKITKEVWISSIYGEPRLRSSLRLAAVERGCGRVGGRGFSRDTEAIGEPSPLQLSLDSARGCPNTQTHLAMSSKQTKLDSSQELAWASRRKREFWNQFQEKKSQQAILMPKNTYNSNATANEL